MPAPYSKYWLVWLGATGIVVVVGVVYAASRLSTTVPASITSNSTVNVPVQTPVVTLPPVAPVLGAQVVAPIAGALARVTKKPFGIKVSPTDSPVQPERFAGYHTGVDFETYPSEADTAVEVHAICEGQVLLKKWATGYGGVLVQSCTLDKSAVTVIYGHLQLASISVKVGDKLGASEVIGVLGKGYSSETDGERKHLHLGIHRGTQVNILGYTPTVAGLSNWIDVTSYLNK